MKNLNRLEIANHLHTSLAETHPYDREIQQPGPSGGNIAITGEYSSRVHSSPGSQFRDDRSFTQSLWGRR
jgi:hypothetical protein